jgi:ankyrin repeat protein
LNKLGQDGETPIFQACKHNHYNIFSFLLLHESNPLIHNNNNETCLDWACLNNNKDIIFSLLNYYNQKDYKIPIDQINKVLVWSVQEDQIEITKVLLPKGNVNCKDNNGESLVSIACKNGSDLMMKLLLHNGATPLCFKEIDDTVNETVNDTNEEIILPPMFPEESQQAEPSVPSETCMDQVIECLETLIEEVVDEIEDDPTPEPDSKKKKEKK